MEKEKKITDTEGRYNIPAPLFVMFGEYLGYVGETNKWCDEWCTTGKKPEDYKVRFIETEASLILKEAKKAFTKQEIRDFYDTLYDAILSDYDEILCKRVKV